MRSSLWLAFLAAAGACGQHINGAGPLLALDDGSCLFVGSHSQYNGLAEHLEYRNAVFRVDGGGGVRWQVGLSGGMTSPINLGATPTGQFLVEDGGQVLTLDDGGGVLSKAPGHVDPLPLTRIVGTTTFELPMPDGGRLVVQRNESSVPPHIDRIAADGSTLFSRDYPDWLFLYPATAIPDAHAFLNATGKDWHTASVLRIDGNGNVNWSVSPDI